jgi:hypothetical protein
MSALLSTASPVTTNETRTGLTRRFTTNGLPTLSPIGQQRRMAAGDTMQVSDTDIKSAWEDSMGSAILALRYWRGKCSTKVERMATCFFPKSDPLSGQVDSRRVH